MQLPRIPRPACGQFASPFYARVFCTKAHFCRKILKESASRSYVYFGAKISAKKVREKCF